jgi:hypothetical protein
MRADLAVQQQGPATPLRDQIRTEVQTTVRQQIREAMQAREQGVISAEQAARIGEEAARAAEEAARAAAAAAGGAPGTVFRVGPNGELQPVEGVDEAIADAVADATAGVQPPFVFQPHVPPEVVSIFISLFAMIAFIIVGLPIARAFGRRMDRRSTVVPETTVHTAQLQQIQTAVEAMAVEVERISENQRFVTRLLSERGAEARLPARPHEEPRGAS